MHNKTLYSAFHYSCLAWSWLPFQQTPNFAIHYLSDCFGSSWLRWHIVIAALSFATTLLSCSCCISPFFLLAMLPAVKLLKMSFFVVNQFISFKCFCSIIPAPSSRHYFYSAHWVVSFNSAILSIHLEPYTSYCQPNRCWNHFLVFWEQLYKFEIILVKINITLHIQLRISIIICFRHDEVKAIVVLIINFSLQFIYEFASKITLQQWYKSP